MSKKYGVEFREEAIRLVTESGISVAQVARDLGVSVWTMRDWLKKHHKASGGTGRMRPESLELENARLKRENAVLRQEREILKKAAAYFAREQL